MRKLRGTVAYPVQPADTRITLDPEVETSGFEFLEPRDQFGQLFRGGDATALPFFSTVGITLR